MTIKVYHAPRETFMKINHDTYDNDSRVAMANEDIEKYTQVLEIEVGQMALDDVYRWTNHIDENWGTNFGFVTDARSTSIGDIIEMGDTKYMVSSFGFSNMGEDNGKQ